jgi:hypothetical protein
MSFFIEANSNSPYKSLVLSNIGFGIYNLTLLTSSEIEFPIYFILLSFLACSWFFVLKNIEEEEDEDRGYLRSYHNDSIDIFIDTEDENNKENTSLEKSTAFHYFKFSNVNFSKLFESKALFILRIFFKKDTVHYEHPQRKYVYAFTYLILTSILVSFFYV